MREIGIILFTMCVDIVNMDIFIKAVGKVIFEKLLILEEDN